MRSCDVAHPSGDSSLAQKWAIQTSEKSCRPSLGRVMQIDQLNLPPFMREIQQVSQILIHIENIREAKIIALRQEIESGQYHINADEVAEKIMTEHLLNLF
jgi:flagellar biosynthesis anti-sigma factor FlgM